MSESTKKDPKVLLEVLIQKVNVLAGSPEDLCLALKEKSLVHNDPSHSRSSWMNVIQPRDGMDLESEAGGRPEAGRLIARG
jgi:hypothetical protein